MHHLPVGVHHLVAAALAGVLGRVVSSADSLRYGAADPRQLDVQPARDLCTSATLSRRPGVAALLVSVSMAPYLSLLADDGDSILELDVVEKALQEDVGHSDQVVVLLRFVERVAAAAGFSVSLVEQTKPNTGASE